MIAVRCPGVTTGRGERLVSERRVRGLVAVADGFLLTIACPCGQEHHVAIRRDLRDVA
jgi:hypothetical protein